MDANVATATARVRAVKAAAATLVVATADPARSRPHRAGWCRRTDSAGRAAGGDRSGAVGRAARGGCAGARSSWRCA